MGIFLLLICGVVAFVQRWERDISDWIRWVGCGLDCYCIWPVGIGRRALTYWQDQRDQFGSIDDDIAAWPRVGWVAEVRKAEEAYPGIGG